MICVCSIQKPEEGPVFTDSRTVLFQDIYDGPAFSIGIFRMPCNSIIPLHDHPCMIVMGRLLSGTLRAIGYEFLQLKDESHIKKLGGRPAILRYDHEFVAPCQLPIILPNGSANVHFLEATSDCAFLDVQTPPYGSERPCSYFDVLLPSAEVLHSLMEDDILHPDALQMIDASIAAAASSEHSASSSSADLHIVLLKMRSMPRNFSMKKVDDPSPPLMI